MENNYKLPDYNKSLIAGYEQKYTEMHSTLNPKDMYTNNPAVKCLIGLIPYVGSMINTVISGHLSKMEADRVKIFYNKLAEDGFYINKEIIESDDFLHCFTISYTATIRTHQKEKIERFATLLKAHVNSGLRASVDLYEVYLKIIDSLTNVEFIILKMLYDKEKEMISANNSDTVQKTNEVYLEIQSKLNISKELLESYIGRIKGQGLIEIIEGLADYNMNLDCGKISQLFKDLVVYIES